MPVRSIPSPEFLKPYREEEHDMTDHESTQWQKLYQKALLERDLEVLPADIARAEAAIYSRLKHLSKHVKDEDERHAISDALSALRVLKRQHFPDWNSASEREIGRAKSSGGG
jgi:hypothetical protein